MSHNGVVGVFWAKNSFKEVKITLKYQYRALVKISTKKVKNGHFGGVISQRQKRQFEGCKKQQSDFVKIYLICNYDYLEISLRLFSDPLKMAIFGFLGGSSEFFNHNALTKSISKNIIEAFKHRV